jgi:hypothetical protein
MIFPPIDVAVLIRDVNASNEAVEDQCLRTRQAADTATQRLCRCGGWSARGRYHRPSNSCGDRLNKPGPRFWTAYSCVVTALTSV